MSLGTNQLYKRLVLSYDLAGNLTAITYPDDTRDAFTYDALNRLTAVTDALSGTTKWPSAPSGVLARMTR